MAIFIVLDCQHLLSYTHDFHLHLSYSPPHSSSHVSSLLFSLIQPVADTDIATVLRTIEAAKKGYLIADLNRDHTTFHALHPAGIADALALADYNIASNYSNMNGLNILPRVETSQ